MTLSEYADLVLTCKSFETDVKGYQNSYNETVQNIERLKAEQSQRINSITADRASFIREEISRKVNIATQGLREQQSGLNEKLTDVSNKSFRYDRESLVNFYIDYIKICKESKRVLKRRVNEQKTLLKILKEPDSKEIDIKGISNISEELSEGIKVLREDTQQTETEYEEEETESGLLTFIFNISEQIDESNRVIFYGSLVLIVVAAIAYNPMLVILPSLIYTLISYFYAADKRHKELEALSKLKYYYALCKKLEKTLKEKMEQGEQKARENFESQKKQDIQSISKELEEVKKQIISIEQNIHRSVSESSASENFEEEQRAAISREFDSQLISLRERAEELKQEYEEKLAELNEAIEQRDKAKQEIEEQYFNLTTCGTGKVLPDMFLLGMNEYEPITLKMLNYCAHLISTTKNNTGIFTNFVNMCVSQILCSMNPSCVHIYLIDTEHGTGRFGIFGSLSEINIVNLIKTPEELSDIIDTLYDIKSTRDQTITVEEDTLNKYNEKMIANYGLTEPYYIIISTHPTMELIKNPKYMQLLNAGNMGIVVINVWDRKIFELREDDNAEDGKDKVNFLQSILASCKLSEDETSNLSSISKDGVIIPMKKQEIEAKYMSLVQQVNKAK